MSSECVGGRFKALQVNADFTLRETPKGLQEELTGLRFDGPGLYLAKDNTCLIIPDVCHERQMWHQHWPPNTLFRAYVYQVDISDTLLGQFPDGVIPIRQDTREG